MPSYTPPTHLEGMVRPSQDRHTRAIARIAGPMPVGNTVWKKSGTWHMKATPSSSDIEDADPIFVGGHVYSVSDDVHDELVAAGYA